MNICTFTVHRLWADVFQIPPQTLMRERWLLYSDISSMQELLTKKELDDFFEILKRSIQDLEICISNIEAIIFAHDTKYQKIHTINNFLGHYIYLAYAYSALNIYKMFKSDEKRSFRKLFNKLENFTYSADLKQILANNKTKEDQDKLFKSKSEIKSEIVVLKNIIEKEQATVDVINNRRLSFYAHYDPDKKFPPEKLKDLKSVTEVAKQIFDRLHGKFYNSSFFFSNYYWTVKPVLDANEFLYDYYKKLEDDLDNLE